MPTVYELIDQVNRFDASGDKIDDVPESLVAAAADNLSAHLHKTKLAPYVDYFARAFLRPVQKALATAERARRDAASRATNKSALDF